jgi:hypothetical protein
MSDVNYDKTVEMVRALSPAEQERLMEELWLEVRRPKPLKSLEQIIAEQGVKPVDFEALLKTGELFPAEESVDDFLNFVTASRQEGEADPLERLN